MDFFGKKKVLVSEQDNFLFSSPLPSPQTPTSPSTTLLNNNISQIENARSAVRPSEDYQGLIKFFEIDEHASFKPPAELLKDEFTQGNLGATLPKSTTNPNPSLKPMEDGSFQGLVRHFNIEQYATFNNERKPAVDSARSTRFGTTPAYSFSTYSAPLGSTPNIAVISSALSSRLSNETIPFFLLPTPAWESSTPIPTSATTFSTSTSTSTCASASTSTSSNSPKLKFSFSKPAAAAAKLKFKLKSQAKPRFSALQPLRKRMQTKSLLRRPAHSFLAAKLKSRAKLTFKAPLAKVKGSYFSPPPKRLPLNLKWKTTHHLRRQHHHHHQLPKLRKSNPFVFSNPTMITHLHKPHPYRKYNPQPANISPQKPFYPAFPIFPNPRSKMVTSFPKKPVEVV